jgi:hypothetical protein
LRNPNGLAWQPASGELWTVVNERDLLGSDLDPRVEPQRPALGLCHLAGGRLYRIASAVEANSAALGKLVDFHALRKSVTKQLVATCIEITRKEKKLGLLGKTLAGAVSVNSYAEPIIAQLINEQTLIDLLAKGEGGGAKVPEDFAPFSRSALQSSWRTWWASESGVGDYYVYLPPDKSPDKQFKVKLSLKEWQRKLAGIDMPKPMLVQLAQELVKRRTDKKDQPRPHFDNPIQRFLRASRFDSEVRCVPAAEACCTG